MASDKDSLLAKCKEYGIKAAKSTSIKKLEEKIIQYENNKELVSLRPGKVVKYVYHIADIHIRYIERHQEYRDVFNKFYEKLMSSPDKESSIVVICGDIFHNRDRFVSETIILFDEFLKNISSIMDVVMILGNHDTFNHKERLDTLSGIMKIKNYENVFLLKKSGIVEYGDNLLFGVSSILDGYLTPCPDSRRVCIGLYHGIVSGCVLENNYTSNGLSIDTFKNYDIVMLGDVHKTQFLNKEKTIAYPGSLIQQSFKEERNHGFLKWNIKDKTAEFVVIDNEYSFLDLEFGCDLNNEKFSKFSRIRVLLSPQNLQTDIEEFIGSIKEKTEIISLKTVVKDNVLLNDKIKSLEENETFTDTKEEEIIANLVDEKDLEEIYKIHRSLQLKIENEDMNFKNSISWWIKDIEFMNIFSYGGDIVNKISFLEGITGILASNASGKTSILNTILYGLFGNIYTRNQNQNNRNIISRFAIKKDLYVKLNIQTLNGDVYTIHRTAKNRSRGETQILLTETLDFYTGDKKLNQSTKNDTERLLRETLSFTDKEDFIITNLISNSKNINIAELSGSELDDVFNNMFNLNKYKLLNKESKAVVKTEMDDIKVLRGKNQVLDFFLDKHNLNDCKKEQKMLVKQLAKNREEIKSKNLEIDDLDTSLLLLKKVDISFSKESIIEEIKDKTLQIEGVNIQNHLDSENDYEESISLMTNEYNTLKDFAKMELPLQIPDKYIPDIEKEINTLEGKKTSIDSSVDITNDYLKAKQELKNYDKQEKIDINRIKEIVSGMESIGDDYLLLKEDREEILSNLGRKIIDPGEYVRYKELVAFKESRDLDIKKNIETHQSISRLKIELKALKISKAHTLKKDINRLNTFLNNIDTFRDIQELQEKLSFLSDNAELSVLISKKKDLQESLYKIQEIERSIEIKLSSLEAIIKEYNSTMERRNENDMLVRQKESSVYFHKIYTDITHSKNLPKILISNIIKSISAEANKIIFNTTGLVCEIEQGEKWSIVLKKNDISIGPNHVSGYENFVINTALKLSLDRHKISASIKLLMIDETIDCVSEDNFENLDFIFEYLQRHYKNILLISHNEELKKRVNNRINIQKTRNISTII